MSKKKKKLKFHEKLFQQVNFDPEKNETFAIAFLGALVFFVALFFGAEMMGSHSEKIPQALVEKEIQTGQYPDEGISVGDSQTEENISLQGTTVSETMSRSAGVVERLAKKISRQKQQAREQAALKAYISSGPVLAGKTSALPDGRRYCTGNSDNPQKGGKTHIDEDCCADYNEYPNPRCYYSPEKMSILKQR